MGEFLLFIVAFFIFVACLVLAAIAFSFWVIIPFVEWIH